MLWNGSVSGKYYGNENLKGPVHIMVDQKQLENDGEYFPDLGSMITYDARCTLEIKSRSAMAKAAFKRKKTLVTRKLDFNLRKKLVKCYIWSIALYGAETWTLEITSEIPRKF
jgi:hypothetical protein